MSFAQQMSHSSSAGALHRRAPEPSAPLSARRRTSLGPAGGAAPAAAPLSARGLTPVRRRQSLTDLGADARSRQQEPVAKQEWVTKQATTWRTGPSDVAFKIDILPKGWRIVEASSQEGAQPGWLRVEPRGFVRCRALAKPAAAQPAAAAVPQDGAAGGGGAEAHFAGLSTSALFEEEPADQSTLSTATGGCDSARAALLALREEHIRLREANVKLKEKQLENRKEIDVLEGQRSTLREEVEKLADMKKHHMLAIQAARQKLSLCRRTIKQAVRSVDRAYGMPCKEDAEGGKMIIASPGSDDKLSEIPSISSELEVADAAVANLIASLDGHLPESVSSVACSPHHGQENASPALGMSKAPHEGQENIIVTKGCGIKEENALDDRVATVAAAQQRQQQQPQGRTPLRAINA